MQSCQLFYDIWGLSSIKSAFLQGLPFVITIKIPVLRGGKSGRFWRERQHHNATSKNYSRSEGGNQKINFDCKKGERSYGFWKNISLSHYCWFLWLFATRKSALQNNLFFFYRHVKLLPKTTEELCFLLAFCLFVFISSHVHPWQNALVILIFPYHLNRGFFYGRYWCLL